MNVFSQYFFGIPPLQALSLQTQNHNHNSSPMPDHGKLTYSFTDTVSLKSYSGIESSGTVYSQIKMELDNISRLSRIFQEDTFYGPMDSPHYMRKTDSLDIRISKMTRSGFLK